MRAFLALLAKDLRLLWRDRVGLAFLALAPIAVITVAGLSLANLYGADPTGQTAYELPLADEDGAALGRDIRDRLAREPAVRLHPVDSREEAERLVRDKQAGTALVIPKGTQAALDAGKPRVTRALHRRGQVPRAAERARAPARAARRAGVGARRDGAHRRPGGARTAGQGDRPPARRGRRRPPQALRRLRRCGSASRRRRRPPPGPPDAPAERRGRRLRRARRARPRPPARRPARVPRHRRRPAARLRGVDRGASPPGRVARRPDPAAARASRAARQH